MPNVYLPYAGRDTGTPAERIVIDPVTRIEGHLRLELEVEGGRVVDAWSSGTMFRGIELILADRDPREAWLLAQRICGVCTTVHALCSVRAVENALGIEVPDNAHLIRNLITGVQFLQDHVVHFYHLHGPDWADLTVALQGDPAATADLARAVSDWPESTPEHFKAVRDRLQAFAASGQLGFLGAAYWGHPAYQLSPEESLLVYAHYLAALGWQRDVIKMQALLGGKNPHPQSYLVGGMSTTLGEGHADAVDAAQLAELRRLAQVARDFVQQVYYPDLLLVAGAYPEWAAQGVGVGNYITMGEFLRARGSGSKAPWLPAGVVVDRRLGVPPATVDQAQIVEDVTRSWYQSDDGAEPPRHPFEGRTQPRYTGPEPPFERLNTDAQYSWLKAPRYGQRVMEVGPLARMAVAYASGETRARELIDAALGQLDVGLDGLVSTVGRILARGVETALIAEQLPAWIDALEDNMGRGDVAAHNGTLWDPSMWPDQAEGWAAVAAPRGFLTHWVRIRAGKIAHYQIVVPSTWNGSPRDRWAQRGPWEQALVGTPVHDPARPLEVLRTVHSFDPCMACAVHLVDARRRPIAEVQLV